MRNLEYPVENGPGRYPEPTTNEAAERLHKYARMSKRTPEGRKHLRELLDDALAAERDAATKEHAAEDEVAIAAAFAAGSRHERRATVERIRAEFEGRTWHPDDKERIDRILDEEAAR